jgi:hypothetical protein
VFYLSQNVKKKTLNVVVNKDGKNVLSSQRIDSKLKNISPVVVPRKAAELPTVAILARLGTKQVLQVLDQGNRWQDLTLPRVSSGSSITAAVGVRLGRQTYLILQVTTKTKVTSYVRLMVPGKHL